MHTRPRVRRAGLVVALVAICLTVVGVVHSRSASAAPAAADLTAAVRGRVISAYFVNPSVFNEHGSRVEAPSQPADIQGGQALNVAATLDRQGGYVRFAGPRGRMVFIAHRRDGGIRVAAVLGPIVESWIRRGSETIVGYPIDEVHALGSAERSRCPAGTMLAQRFARLREPVAQALIACLRSDNTVAWA